MPRRAAPQAAMAAVLALSAGCAGQRLAWEPDALRAEVARRAPDLRRDDVPVPYAIDAETAARARAAVVNAGSQYAKVRRLLVLLFDAKVFGVRYVPGVTVTAEETLRRREGSCFSLASLFVGMARAVGLEAYYMDASPKFHEMRLGPDGMAVNEGHITAVVETSAGKVALDFERLGPLGWYRVLSDVEALGHFYNNRAYERIERERQRGDPADWAEAARQFRLATEVEPGLARAWNNLGIAAAHLGRRDEAVAAWREAIRRDPALPAPLNNLGALYLEAGDDRAARATLEQAARLDGSGPHVRYNLALARLRTGDRAGAVDALRSALRGGPYAPARRLLDELTVVSVPPGAGEEDR